MSQPLRTAAIRAEPDGYAIDRAKLMGRHTAGHGFLRAAVAARGDGPLYACTPHERSAKGFAALVRSIDSAAETVWIHSDHLAQLSQPGVLYLADATVPSFARLRLRQGMTSFSICGVTHTTATTGATDAITDLLREPVAPWDALICTSRAVAETVRRLHEAEADYLRWRLGPDVRIETCQLPVIPLGVHCDDFAFTEDEVQAARAALGLEPDEVAGLFVGRLLFHGKAHPLPMFRALQATAERTGRRMALILCGWAPNAAVQRAFEEGAARHAPSVRTLFVDGRQPEGRRHAWAAGDIFLSLSDNIQETFGLTPIEAMAAGLPAVVTDWNGYRDTVRNGVDGFRVSTWAPSPGGGAAFAKSAETGGSDYDLYCWNTAAVTAVETGEVTEVLSQLAMRPALRRRMGEAGRARAREVYDWPVVYAAYQALWGELNARRLAAEAQPDAPWNRAPREAPRRMEPFTAFGHYATRHIGPATRLALAPGATPEALAALTADVLFTYIPVGEDFLQRLLAHVAEGETDVARAAAALGAAAAALTRAAGLLAKMGLVRLSNPA